MKNQWITFFLGRVLVKVTGKGIERFLNKMTHSGLSIWAVKRNKKGEVSFYVALPDVNKLRVAARKSDCSIYLMNGEGLPFLWRRTIKNSGFLFGLVIFFLIILFLSNVTWGIQIKGADPATEHKIREELKALGIVEGSMHLFAEKPDIIQRKLTDQIDNITWVGVELKGTTYHFQVVQKNEPKKSKPESPRHLVASKRAVIANMFVEKGKTVVEVNQYVEKGQLLVSGTIGNDENPQNVIAKGKIWGLTWYNTKVEFPLNSEFQVLSGEEKRKYSLKVGKISIPIWGFAKVDYLQYEAETDDNDIYFLGKKLPVKISKKTIREKEIMNRNFSKQEAIEAAKLLAKRDLEMKIPSDARLDKEIILQEAIENGKVKLSINFQVIENIAVEKPIIQGD